MKQKQESQLCVVIADNYIFYRHGLKHCLESAGFSVVGEAGTPEEALARVKDLKPDVLLLDYDLLSEEALQALCMNEGIRILMMGAPEDEETMLRAIEDGASGFILKTAEPEDFLKAVRMVAGGGCFAPREMMGHLFDEVRRSRKTSIPVGQREMEVLKLLASGLHNAQIAERLFISEQTVKCHITNLFRKLGLTDRVQATRYAIRHRLVRA